MYKDTNFFDCALISEHAVLVKKIAYHLAGRLPSCIQVEDLIQSGMIGLLEAAKNYNDTKGASFATYAGIRIRGAMLDEIRKGDWAPRSVHRNTRKIAQAIHEVESIKKEDARDIDVAKHLKVSLEEYHQMLQDTLGTRVFGFDDLLNNEFSVDTTSNSLPGPAEGLQQQEFKKKLTTCIAGLPERERLILALYYDEELNLREVGEIIGVSESRVSQIHSQAMIRLQSRMADW